MSQHALVILARNDSIMFNQEASFGVKMNLDFDDWGRARATKDVYSTQ